METFTRDGLVFDVEDRGPRGGEAIVLLHGFPDDAHAYDGVAPLVAAKGYRALAVYLRGFGPTRFRHDGTPRSGQIAGLCRDLRELLDALGRSYAVYVSAATHETAALEDAQAVFEEMRAIFPRLYFLGNLSDVAVSNELRRATFFAAFFPRGVRANNTSVAAAMELGAVVITNLDRYSPSDLVHMKNVIDLRQCESLPTDPLDLERLRGVAAETVRRRDWDALVARLT
jgi:pimeloyl-ACP methyl ester carboxylesterase